MATPVAFPNLPQNTQPETLVEMVARVLPFPVLCACPACGRACSDEDLNECSICWGQYCGRTGCSMKCHCDDLADRVALRIERLRPSLWQRVANFVRQI